MQWAKSKNKQAMIELFIKHGEAPIESKSKNNKKMPPPAKQKVNDKKIPKPFMLTVLRDGQYCPLSQQEFDQFKREHPHLARYFSEAPTADNSPLDSLDTGSIPDTAPIQDCWDKAAKKLLNNLMKHSHAWIFLEPVDPEKLQIPDYYDIIKQPMDFGTIKNNLQGNKYLRAEEFINDVFLVFDNCLKYNGENSHVSIMCKNVKDEYKKLFSQLSFNYYL